MNNYFLIILASGLFSCGQTNEKQSAKTSVTEVARTTTSNAPEFNPDSAYTYIANQAAFGPRVPNTPAHKACAEYLVNELKRFGAQTFVQEAILTAYDGTKLEAQNIIGSYNLENSRRILLFAHWDSRPYADADPDEANWHKHIDGVDDGASGVGVLLEIARQINMRAPNYGIDIIFFDAEDYGVPAFSNSNVQDSWALGSQFWAAHPHIPNYKAEFGILLDMVGCKNAVFYKEVFSTRYAAPYVEEIWNTARNLGYGRYFINARSVPITDDHIYVIQGRNIPCVNIINYDPNTEKGFSAHWHTINDTMENIDTQTLNAVGHTVLEVIYNR
jgi:Predicted aminopeptidases